MPEDGEDSHIIPASPLYMAKKTKEASDHEVAGDKKTGRNIKRKIAKNAISALQKTKMRNETRRKTYDNLDQRID